MLWKSDANVNMSGCGYGTVDVYIATNINAGLNGLNTVHLLPFANRLTNFPVYQGWEIVSLEDAQIGHPRDYPTRYLSSN